MTGIKSKRGPYETNALVREQGRVRPLIVILEPLGLVIRPKRIRRVYRLPYGSLYILAAQAEADAARRQKAEQRKSRKTRRVPAG